VFEIELSETRKAVYIRFHGELSVKDFNTLDELARQRQSDDQYDCIFDLSRIDRVDLAADFVAKRGGLPQTFANRERIYVVPQDDLKLLVKLYAAYQEARGWHPPVIVENLDEAFATLGVSAGDFQSMSAKSATGS
jgi:ABC-type transporter Mla MlaB component